MLWAMFFLETVGPAVHVDVILTHITYLSIAPENVHTLPRKWHSPMAVSFFSRLAHQPQSKDGLGTI